MFTMSRVGFLAYPSIAAPILLRDHAVYGGLDGCLHVVPLSGEGEPWAFKTAWGYPITAPACVCDGRVYFGCEDGYLYVLGPGGHAPPPSKDLELWKIRSPLATSRAAAEYDWYTNYGDFAGTNANDQGAAPQGTEKAYVHKGEPEPRPDGAEVMSFIYSHNNPYYPKDNRPCVAAWDMDTGEPVWQRDFSELGTGGNDSGLCLLDGMLYYSTFFGYAAQRRGEPGPRGLTAALDPATGKVLWQTTDYYVTAGCTISGADGRLYLGGYNQPREGTEDRYVWCLDARDGSLVWRSEPVGSAVNVVTVAGDVLFSNASGKDAHVIDKRTGKILSRFNFGYACTRFTFSAPYVLGSNMDMIDLRQGNRLVTTGPAIDSRECIGSVISNGRLFYTSQASGIQAGKVYGEEAKSFRPVWQRQIPTTDN